MDGHRRLDVWRQARALVVEIYSLTRSLPPDEKYVLTPQLRRAAWSMSCNIAEGNAKLGGKELRRYFDSALGSLAELDSMILIAADLYELDAQARARIDALRIGITRGIFGILRARAR